MGITAKKRREIDEIVIQLVKLKHRCFRAGLLRTGHELDKATTMVGYEYADLIEGKQVLRHTRVDDDRSRQAHPGERGTH